MAEFLSSQAMDPFLVSPRVKADGEDVDFQPHNLSGDLIPIFVNDKMVTVKAGKSAVQSAGPLHHSFADEAVFSRGYNSEEEAASPTEDNDFQSTDTESNPSIREAPSTEEFSVVNFNALQLCNKAQAIQIVSAGKPKIVSVPKSPDVPYFDRRIRSSNEAPGSARVPRFEIPIRVSSDMEKGSPRSSSDRSPTTPTSNAFSEWPYRPREIRRKPKLPPLEGVPTSHPRQSTRTQTPLAMQRADFGKQDSSPSSSSDASPASPSSPSYPKRKTSKFSPTFNFRFGRPRRSDSTASSSSGGSYDYMEYHAISQPPPTTGAYRNYNSVPTPKKSMPKMVPRGASERAPPIVIPPCPSEFASDDWNVDYESDWPLRGDSVFASVGNGAYSSVRRKSMAAALVTSQT